MAETVEPNAGDILASKLGVDSARAELVSLKFLFAELLATLRRKALIEDAEIDMLLSAVLNRLSESYGRTNWENPESATYVANMKADSESIIATIRADISQTGGPKPSD